MNPVGISTDPSLLNVELASTLIASSSVSTFLPEEDASIYPLLSNNGNLTPLTFLHPLMPNEDYERNTSAKKCIAEKKIDVSLSSSSSSDFGIDLHARRQRIDDSTTKNIFNKHIYQHFENNNALTQESNGPISSSTFVLSKDAPCFVSWNWPLIRKITFFVFLSMLLAMCAIVVALVVNLPKSCNPKNNWYQGTVFLQINSSNFRDTDGNGPGISQIINEVEYFESLGVAAIYLNSFPWISNYGHDMLKEINSKEINSLYQSFEEIRILTNLLHSRQMYLVVDLPINLLLTTKLTHTYLEKSKVLTNSSDILLEEASGVSEILIMLCRVGIDGFFIRGIHGWMDEVDLNHDLNLWRKIIGSKRILIIAQSDLNRLNTKIKSSIMPLINLVDVQINISNGLQSIEKQFKDVLHNEIDPLTEKAWILWSIGTESQHIAKTNQNISLALTLMQLMLPGSVSIFYNKESNKTSCLEYLNEAWYPVSSLTEHTNSEIIGKMIQLRKTSPSIYQNAICKTKTKLSNTQILMVASELLVIERTYPRRNSFISVSNLNTLNLSTDMSSLFYCGKEMLITDSTKVYFQQFEIAPHQTKIIKLDK